MAQALQARATTPDIRLSGDSTRPTTIGSENRFQKAILAWRDIDLSTQIPQLDAAASDIIAHQRDVLVKRKDLAQKTKEFRRLDESGKLAEIKGLLKLYQTFIDDVSNQSKVVQSAFLQLYTPLSEAPDPYPLLESSVDSLMMVEDNLPRLKKENERLNKSISRLTGQADEREKQLEEERRSRLAAETAQLEKVKEIEETWTTVLKEKEGGWDSERSALADKLADQDRLVKELKATNEISNRLVADGGASDRSRAADSAAAAELEILNSELERTTIRLAGLEKRNLQLTTQITDSISHRSIATSIEDEPAFVRLRADNGALLDRIESLKDGREQDRSDNQAELSRICRDLDSARRDRDDFRSKLHRWKDYDVIKDELEVLKRVDFGFSLDDPDDRAEDTAGHEDRLEKLLLDRNKKLSNDLTEMRLAQTELERRLGESNDRLANLTADLSTAHTLNRTLEADLEKMQQEVEHSFAGPALSVAGGRSTRQPYSWKPKRTHLAPTSGRISPTSSIISGWGPSPSEAGGPEPSVVGSTAGSGSSAGPGILPMVTAQRDRFKKQVADLEMDVQRNQTTIAGLRSEMEALKQDNVQLYEQKRYLTAVSSSKAGPSNPSVINMPALSAPSTTTRSLDQYRKAYENHLSPFANFRASETARGMRRLSLPERMLLAVVKFIVRDRLMCNLFAIYFFIVHMVLFSVLFSSGPPPSPPTLLRARSDGKDVQ